MRYINGVSQKDIEDNSLYVIRYTYGYRNVVPGSELQNSMYDEEEIKDIDWLVFDQQPEELKPFFDWYEEHESELPYFIKDIFEQYGEEIEEEL